MILRSCILLIAILAHVLTPNWFLKDFLIIEDWIMVFFGLLSVFIYILGGKDKKVLLFSLVLSLSILIYFITTVQMLTPDIGVNRIIYRLSIIFDFSIDIPIRVGTFIEMFNATQIVFNTIIVFLIIQRFYNKKFTKVSN